MSDFIQEGKAKILAGKDVFYNPVQCFNRDMSILAAMVVSNDMESEWNERQEKKASQKTKALQSQTHKQKSTNDTLLEEGEKRLCLNDDLPDPTQFPGLSLLDALAASGLRALRYFSEIPQIHTATANDFDEDAVKAINDNITLNNFDRNRFHAHQGDATFFMNSAKNSHQYFDIIDLDPYGTAAPFLDSAILCLSEGGFLSVTCTDMGVLAGNHVDACFNKYGVVPHKAKYCHEMAIRILLSCVAQHAARHGKYIVPLMSLSVDFYVRCFLRVFTSPSKSKNTACKLSHMYQCNTCPAFWLQPLAQCTISNKSQRDQRKHAGEDIHVTYKYKVVPSFPFDFNVVDGEIRCGCCHYGRILSGGPIWSERIHDPVFVQKMVAILRVADDGTGTNIPPIQPIFQTKKRMLGTLGVIGRELEDNPFYYSFHDLCGFFRMSPVSPMLLAIFLIQNGYKVSNSHTAPVHIKTSAPPQVVFDFFRHIIRLRQPERLNEVPAPDAAEESSSESEKENDEEQKHPVQAKEGKRKGLSPAVVFLVNTNTTTNPPNLEEFELISGNTDTPIPPRLADLKAQLQTNMSFSSNEKGKNDDPTSLLPRPRFIPAPKGFGPKAKAHKGPVSQARLEKQQKKEDEKKAKRQAIKDHYEQLYGKKGE
ncbi:putative tRNA (guanine26-N2/guanine27-N2)-dimethyltransferase [Blattamonas nauphoetae]|uniref:tRNA (guanine(26)-N(2))-dimethyltransferase n=1 Tax=Blattamonas nauphoetae TaxID=2049346 RepID=A0ABQ9XJB0_9EUKA|nr:putative tRNA (guanine26-N2/guanine27-N2)-dimethyltransferase [Blattamonas nauphoetae]